MTSDEQPAAGAPTPSVVDQLADTLRSGTILNLHGATITANLIRDSLLGKPQGDDKKPVIALGDIDPRGLRITNAVITGPLDLTNTHIGPRVEITQSQLTDHMTVRNAHLDHDLNLQGCSLPSLDMTGAHITGQLNMTGAHLTDPNQDGDSLIGDGLQVDSAVFLRDGFTAAGGIRLPGAHITGQLNMTGAQLTGTNQDGDSLFGDGLQVDGNVFLRDGFTAAGAIRLPGAHITGQLDMTGAQLTGTNQAGHSLSGDGLQVDSNVFLRDGFTAAGAIRLQGAHITGQLDMTGAQLTDPNQAGHSLIGDGLQVDSAVLLNDGFTAAGAIRLPGAHITGQLDMTGAQLTGTNQAGHSLIGDRLQVDSNVFLNDGFTAAGAIRLPGAHITGQLDMTGAQLTGPNQAGDSLFGDRLQVDGDVLLNDGFTAAGAIRLPGAHITGQLEMTGAQLTGTNQAGDSLFGDRLQVDGSVLLNDGFTAAGAIRLPGAHITGQLDMTGAQLTGPNQAGHSLFGDDLQVDGDAFLDGGFTAARAVGLSSARLGGLWVVVSGLRAGAVAKTPGLTVAGAVVGDLRWDLDGVAWFPGSRVRPNKRQRRLPEDRVLLSLENCTYSHRPPGQLDAWLRLLRFHTPEYEPRSYQQLAAVHRATGHDRDSSRILMAQQDHRRAVALRPTPGASYRHRVGLWASRAGLAIWKATLGYGYRPRRALAWLLGLLVTAGLMVTFAAHWPTDLNTPDVPVAYRPANPDTGTGLGYCSLGEATGLAVRIAIPLVTNLGQGACIIDTTSTPGSWIVLASIALQTFAWILGGLTIAAAATAIKRSA